MFTLSQLVERSHRVTVNNEYCNEIDGITIAVKVLSEKVTTNGEAKKYLYSLNVTTTKDGKSESVTAEWHPKRNIIAILENKDVTAAGVRNSNGETIKLTRNCTDIKSVVSVETASDYYNSMKNAAAKVAEFEKKAEKWKALYCDMDSALRNVSPAYADGFELLAFRVLSARYDDVNAPIQAQIDAIQKTIDLVPETAATLTAQLDSLRKKLESPTPTEVSQLAVLIKDYKPATATSTDTATDTATDTDTDTDTATSTDTATDTATATSTDTATATGKKMRNKRK